MVGRPTLPSYLDGVVLKAPEVFALIGHNIPLIWLDIILR